MLAKRYPWLGDKLRVIRETKDGVKLQVNTVSDDLKVPLRTVISTDRELALLVTGYCNGIQLAANKLATLVPVESATLDLL